MRSPAVNTVRDPKGANPGSAGQGPHLGVDIHRTPLSARRSAPTPVASQVLTATFLSVDQIKMHKRLIIRALYPGCEMPPATSQAVLLHNSGHTQCTLPV